MPEKWEKQDCETPKNYTLFCVYRDMGITRSISKVVLKLQKRNGYNTYLRVLSAEFDWVARATAYDNYLDEENRKANIEAIKKMNEEIIGLARQMRQIPGVRLRAIVEKIRVAYDSHDPGLIEEATKDIPLYLIPQLIETSYMLERKARGVGDKLEIDATVKGEIKNTVSMRRDELEGWLNDRDTGTDAGGTSPGGLTEAPETGKA